MVRTGQKYRIIRYMLLGPIFSLITVFPSLSYGEIKGDKELLRLIAQGYQANLEKISTWQGEARINCFYSGRKRYDKRWSKQSAVFVYNRKLEATRWNWTQLEDRLEKDGQEKQGLALHFKNCMLKDGAFYQFGTITPSEMKRPYRLGIYPPENAYGGELADHFDPLYYFRCARGNVSEDLMWYYRMADDPRMSATITREGNLVTFERTLTGTINRYQFDLSKGCNVVSYLSDDPSVKDSWTLEYEEIDGVFVPRKAIYHNEKPAEGAAKGRIWHREVEFTRNIINQPVNLTEFDLDKLGLQPGDIVQDTRANIEYIYKAEAGEVEKMAEEMVEGLLVEEPEVTPAAETEEPAIARETEPSLPAPEAVVAETAPPFSKRAIYITAGVAALLLVLGIILLALRRKSAIQKRIGQ